jgi:hypothetical protein
MAEVRLACRMVDFRDQPDKLELLEQQKAALAALRHCIREPAAMSPAPASQPPARLRRSLGILLTKLTRRLRAARARTMRSIDRRGRLPQPGHELDQIARPVPVVELAA